VSADRSAQGLRVGWQLLVLPGVYVSVKNCDA
jgi:hypothetical protein